MSVWRLSIICVASESVFVHERLRNALQWGATECEERKQQYVRRERLNHLVKVNQMDPRCRFSKLLIHAVHRVTLRRWVWRVRRSCTRFFALARGSWAHGRKVKRLSICFQCGTLEMSTWNISSTDRLLCAALYLSWQGNQATLQCENTRVQSPHSGFLRKVFYHLDFYISRRFKVVKTISFMLFWDFCSKNNQPRWATGRFFVNHLV